jgi:hypothetical protein
MEVFCYLLQKAISVITIAEKETDFLFSGIDRSLSVSEISKLP